MTERPAAVLRWPGVFGRAQDLLIVAVDTPNTPIRDTARQMVRSVLREILGDIDLISSPGQPLRLARPDSTLGISVSHETGLSLLAIHRSGPVGIDLLRIPEDPGWEREIPGLAGDYLGPQIARQIAELPSAQRIPQFALAWTAHEARLKCRGLALEEWSSALAKELADCQVQRIALPPGYLGAVAISRTGPVASSCC